MDILNNKKTLEYYNSNSSSYFNKTYSTDICDVRDLFLSYIKCNNASILDLGCGSGRDTKYFKDLGFNVTAYDGSIEMCKLASEYSGIDVKNVLFEELNDLEKYTGIWACASLLHLSKEELKKTLKLINRALINDGILYMSFKYGTFEGFREERYYLDFTEESMKNYLSEMDCFKCEKIWVTSDSLSDRGDLKWLNVILRKI